MTEETEKFWTSDEGILIRLEDLAHDFTFKTYNGAIRGFIKDSGFKEFEWVSVMMGNICNYCESQNGRRYRSGQFLPKMPAHNKCRCMWDVYIELG